MYRRLFFLIATLIFTHANAADTLRVGNQVLSVGDSTARVQTLLGKPTSRAAANKKAESTRSGNAIKKMGNAKTKGKGRSASSRGSSKGVKKSYIVDNRTVVLTIADGKVMHIDESVD